MSRIVVCADSLVNQRRGELSLTPPRGPPYASHHTVHGPVGCAVVADNLDDDDGRVARVRWPRGTASAASPLPRPPTRDRDPLVPPSPTHRTWRNCIVKVGRYLYIAVAVAALALSWSYWHPHPVTAANSPNAPRFIVDPFYPRPLPHGWVTGEIGGTCIDADDHLFIVTRGFQTGGLTSPEGVGGAPPSIASPPVIEFDPDGNVVNSFGDPSQVTSGQNAGRNAVLPNGTHGCFIDYQGNFWIGGNSNDGVVQKYSHDGKTMLLQIGTKFVCDRPDLPGGSGPCANANQTGRSRPLLKLPADHAVHPNPDPVNGQMRKLGR